MSDDPKISEHYRELPREEPPRALDEAILAASRRAAEARPAPLVVPTGRRRWYFPVAAAVIVLAVAVVAHVERERPDEEITARPATVPEPPPAPRIEEKRREEAPKPARKAFTPDPRADSAAPAPAAPAPHAAQAERSDAAGAMAGARESRAESRIARAAVEQSPEAELERIAQLRAAGRQEEADKALAEFRKRYPDYRIAPAMLERVEKK